MDNLLTQYTDFDRGTHRVVNLPEMRFFYVLFAISCFNFSECKSIIEQNDTALQLLNNCKCVSRDYCYKGYLNVHGVGIITLRNEGLNESEIQCSNQSNICCRERVGEFGNRMDNTNQKEGKSSKILQATRNVTFKIGKSLHCGKPKPAINIRIFAGEDDISTALDGEFPWIASIHKKNQPDGTFRFRCGGSLITDIVVLTAAHCVYSSRRRPFELRIIANAKKELGEIGLNPSEERVAKNVLIHPEYYSGGAHNDIALIQLERSYNESKDLNNLCLPTSNSTYDKTRCVAAGWGDLNKKILSKVDLSLVDRNVCEEQLRKTRLGGGFQLHESALCAGGEKGKDTCKGDGGGPLICPDGEGYFVQVGIVSWGVECSKEGLPGVYTDVGKFVDWIHDSIGS